MTEKHKMFSDALKNEITNNSEDFLNRLKNSKNNFKKTFEETGIEYSIENKLKVMKYVYKFNSKRWKEELENDKKGTDCYLMCLYIEAISSLQLLNDYEAELKRSGE